MYDPDCYALAEAFLKDDKYEEPKLSQLAKQLAQEIQDTIEDFLEYEATNEATKS